MPVAALTIADVLRLGQRLPSTPQVFSRIGRLLSDPNSSIDEIVKLVIAAAFVGADMAIWKPVYVDKSSGVEKFRSQ